ncbi:DUF350 domain-containing protein [Paenibacillus sp. N1-5-1-14]|uniref:DUF350 domain-containing protein n=1 Tax=Paenibacillus radicibacter TaxID=2972488 RepID=UPI0021594323|nr:DUF350 domain-containing protein [Paenibacillus radicibacter]MCR8642087.1 DUF350 domain-containing protein [Paenibacillus radicibacter]
MTWMTILATLVWTGVGAVLLVVLMGIDSLFTRYKDMEEIKNGNVAVAIRFVMKLFAQGYILSQSIRSSNDLWDAVLASVVSFVILLILELIIRNVLKWTVALNLDEGTKQGKIAHALLGGSLHVVGALVIASYLLVS